MLVLKTLLWTHWFDLRSVQFSSVHHE